MDAGPATWTQNHHVNAGHRPPPVTLKLTLKITYDPLPLPENTHETYLEKTIAPSHAFPDSCMQSLPLPFTASTDAPPAGSMYSYISSKSSTWHYEAPGIPMFR